MIHKSHREIHNGIFDLQFYVHNNKKMIEDMRIHFLSYTHIRRNMQRKKEKKIGMR